jgi:hypothetical protein
MTRERLPQLAARHRFLDLASRGLPFWDSVLPKRRETKAATPPADRLTNDELKQFVRETKRLLAKAETYTDEGETEL